MNLTQLIKRPIITEKALATQKRHRYQLAVAVTATKPQIKAAVEKYFNVTVTQINTALVVGKLKTKKAIIKLKTGQSLPLLSEAEKQEP